MAFHPGRDRVFFYSHSWNLLREIYLWDLSFAGFFVQRSIEYDMKVDRILVVTHRVFLYSSLYLRGY